MADIKVYTKVGCPYCAAMKDSLKDEGVDFEEYDVHASRDNMDEALKLSGGRRMVPVLVRDGRVSVAPQGG